MADAFLFGIVHSLSAAGAEADAAGAADSDDAGAGALEHATANTATSDATTDSEVRGLFI